MAGLKKLQGRRFGYLVVIERAGSARGRTPNKKTLALWRCRCDCGEICVKRGDNLRLGKTKACAIRGHRWGMGPKRLPQYL